MRESGGRGLRRRRKEREASLSSRSTSSPSKDPCQTGPTLARLSSIVLACLGHGRLELTHGPVKSSSASVPEWAPGVVALRRRLYDEHEAARVVVLVPSR